MAKYNRYVLGSKPRLKLQFFNESDVYFIPQEYRLSVKQPDGAIITYSGADITQASGYMYVLYKPPVIGWYEYEGWGKDTAQQEIAQTNGFDVYDRVY